MGYPKVVTLGGGHGQAALLAALRRLRCDVTAVVSVADDGGCSGRLTRQFGMPPPGDLRRCLTTTSCDAELAARFEERLHIDDTDEMRCAGNLALLSAYDRFGSLQQAIDWGAAVLRCWARVVPVAETPGRLAIYDRSEGVLEGETTVAARGSRPMVVAVHDIERSSAAAHRAIEQADVVLMGPGSFVTSTLATLTTGQIATTLVASEAKKVLIHNLIQEPGQVTQFQLADYVSMLRDHVGIHSVAGHRSVDGMALAVLCHDQDGAGAGLRFAEPLADGTEVALADVVDRAAERQGNKRHDHRRLALALATLLKLVPRDSDPTPSRPGSGAPAAAQQMQQLETPDGRQAEFEAFLAHGVRLASAPPPVDSDYRQAAPRAS